MITRMGIFIGCRYGSHVGIDGATLGLYHGERLLEINRNTRFAKITNFSSGLQDVRLLLVGFMCKLG
jgi:hypothetical protein